MGRKWILAIGFCFIFSVAFGETHPAFPHRYIEEQKQENSLAGLKGVSVDVKIGLAREGPTKHRLQSLVEQTLREGGVHVEGVVEEQVEGRDQPPSFCVEVAVFKGVKDYHHFFVTARLYQQVSLTRNQQLTPSAITWTLESMGAGNIDNIYDRVEEVTTIFVKDYQRVNSVKFQ